MVTNAANHSEFAGTGGFFDDIGRFSREWQAQHVLCNEASSPDAWEGELADVKLALAHVRRRNEHPTVFVDASVVALPDFNMAKLVSNMLIRFRSSVATRLVDDTDSKIYSAHDAQIDFQPAGQVPPIERIRSGDARAQPGDFAARPIVFIAREDYGAVEASTADTLINALAEMQQAGRPIYAALIPWCVQR